MNTLKMTLAFGACAAALTANTARADDETAATPRNLKWAYTGEAFETPANWTWADESTGDITTGPGAADRVLFKGASEDKTVRLSADATVSNFIYEASSKGATTVDLAGHTLTVTNDMNVKSDYKIAETAALTFKDGNILFTGTAQGTDVWGQPNEAASGFFFNRENHAYAGVNAKFDNVKVTAVNSPRGTRVALNGSHGFRSSVFLTNGSSWLLNMLRVSNSRHKDTGSSPLTVWVDNSSLETKNDVFVEGNCPCAIVFTNAAALRIGGALRTRDRSGAGLSIVLNGNEHSLGSSAAYGDDGSCSLSYTDVVLTNQAVLTATGTLSVRSASIIMVCDGAALTTSGAFKLGHQAYNNAYFGDSSLVVDNGSVRAKSIDIGGFERYSNNCVRVVGPLSLVEQTGAGMAFNYGATVAFEIPAEGYHDADGVARAPVSTAGAFRSTTTENCRPIGLELATRAFDRANPQTSVTLLQATSDSRKVFAQLMANVTWTDNPNRHGTLSVSEDGKSLVYMAGAKQGLAVIIR